MNGIQIFFETHICTFVNRLQMQKSVDMMRQQIENEQITRRITEESFSTLEKEKGMLEVELRQLLQRHQKDIGAKDATIASVSELR
jgi:hypothetical protein